MKYVAIYESVDAWGDASLTADTIIETEDAPIRTGLLDQYERPLYRVRERVQMGFVPPQRTR